MDGKERLLQYLKQRLKIWVGMSWICVAEIEDMGGHELDMCEEARWKKRCGDNDVFEERKAHVLTEL